MEKVQVDKNRRLWRETIRSEEEIVSKWNEYRELHELKLRYSSFPSKEVREFLNLLEKAKALRTPINPNPWVDPLETSYGKAVSELTQAFEELEKGLKRDLN